MSGIANQILKSKKTVLQRFKKLYRTLFIQFIRKDIMHKEDLQKIIEDTNKRIDQLEVNMNSTASSLYAAIGIAQLNHTHPSPQAPAGTLVTGPGVPTGPVPPPVPSVTGPLGVAVIALSKAEPILNKRFSAEIAKGPAVAPFSDLFDPAAIKASFDITTNVLLGEAGGEL